MGLPETTGDCARRARRRLPRHEADLLVSRALGVPRSALYAFPERPVAAPLAARVVTWVNRRHGGEPVAYILGERGFWGLDLEVNVHSLIPRPDTETLVAAALPRIGPDASVLDLGTGCGAVALAIASERPGARILATDIDPACIALCRRNATRLGLAVRARVADRFEGIGERFDVIVSNPPYVDPADPHLERDDVRFEPRRALAGGPDAGLDFVAGLVRRAPGHLAPGGWLAVEHGSGQGGQVRAVFAASGFAEVGTHRDIEDRERVTAGRRG